MKKDFMHLVTFLKENLVNVADVEMLLYSGTSNLNTDRIMIKAYNDVCFIQVNTALFGLITFVSCSNTSLLNELGVNIQNTGLLSKLLGKKVVLIAFGHSFELEAQKRGKFETGNRFKLCANQM